MSAGQIHIFVRDRDFGDRTLKNVLERIAWFADDEGRSVYPKLQTIADALGLKLRAVQYQMRALEKKELIKVEEEARQHRARVYRLNVKKILARPLTATARHRLELENAAARDCRESGEGELPGVQFTTSAPPQGCNPRHPGVQSTTSAPPQGCNPRHPGVQSTTSPPNPLKKTPARLKAEESYEESKEEELSLTRARRVAPAKAGTRLADDWQPGSADFAYGRDRGFSDQEVEDHASNFKTHFTAGNGRTRTHLRWSGDGHSAFAVWLRKERPGQSAGGQNALGRGGAGRDRPGPASLVAAVDRVED